MYGHVTVVGSSGTYNCSLVQYHATDRVCKEPDFPPVAPPRSIPFSCHPVSVLIPISDVGSEVWGQVEQRAQPAERKEGGGGGRGG
jgi:hypothetical protein